MESTSLHPAGFTLEEPITMRPDGYPRDVELRVALPLSYYDSDAQLPVLWVTDNDLETALPMIGLRDVIVVGVGAPRLRSGSAYHQLRAYDFYPSPDILPPQPYRGFLEKTAIPNDPGLVGGGAEAFLDFLINDARAALTSAFRMAPDDHAIEGYSAGGFFVAFALFSRPGAFAKYIAGAPALYWSDGLIWQLEAEYAASHDDLDASLFLATGDGEMVRPDAQIGCVSSMARLTEVLSCREYSSLDLATQVLPGESHATARPLVIGHAARALWDRHG